MSKSPKPKDRRLPVAVIVGTRPEAVKLAPVILALSASSSLRPVTLNTAQHRQMVGQIFEDFGISTDVDLDVMRPRQTLWGLTARLSESLGEHFSASPAAAVIVQGDTTSAFVGGLCAFYHKIPVAHVEAGLRSGDLYSPFPEEANRSLLGRISSWHFSPTRYSAEQLLREGVDPKKIFVCGNTVVDALHGTMRRIGLRASSASSRSVLITCHRRENLGGPMIAVARAIRRLAAAHPGYRFIFPVHPNPAVRDAVVPVLDSLPNLEMTDPLPYEEFLKALVHAHLVLSDSGGVQEEATSLGKPVLLLRKETERPEGILAGVVKMVGTSEEKIFREGDRLLSSEAAWKEMAKGSKVFGDGRSSARIVKRLERDLARSRS